MDNDTQSVVIGLSAGLGGFFVLLIVICICWQICCGTWCEKKDVPSTTRSIPRKKQRHITTTNMVHNNMSAVAPMRSPTTSSEYCPSSSGDLASKVRQAYR